MNGGEKSAKALAAAALSVRQNIFVESWVAMTFRSLLVRGAP
jgi:hypothetical protein